MGRGVQHWRRRRRATIAPTVDDGADGGAQNGGADGGGVTLPPLPTPRRVRACVTGPVSRFSFRVASELPVRGRGLWD